MPTHFGLPNIQDWLLELAEQQFFTFDRAEFQEDCEEILRIHVEADCQEREIENRNELWELLRAWQRDQEYLSSLNLHRVIAKHVRICCRKLDCKETLESWSKLEDVRLDGLADEIANIIRATLSVRAPLRQDKLQKFSEELSFGTLDKFHLGLENVIGYPAPNADFLELMKREHEQGDTFVDHKGRTIDPKVEWNIVMRCDRRNILGVGCDPTADIKHRECVEPLGFYVERAKEEFNRAVVFCKNIEELKIPEVAALRLWTGPMHIKYAELLRNPRKSSGYAPSPYVNTLHAINSGITKLARMWRLPDNRKVYRGYRGLKIKDLKMDPFKCVGGVENCVLATSESIDVAVDYSEDGAFILEIDVGQVNRGADVSWLSQFPHEREILFNALSNVEFVRSPQRRFVEGRGTILVYHVCISANLKCKTLDEFVRMRKDLHLNLVDVLTQEALGMIKQREERSTHDLIKNLSEECKNKCVSIRREAEAAEVEMFNKGTPEYVSLVEAAIMFQSRSLEIIDFAQRWFDTNKADPTELDRLQDWQLMALKKSFRCSVRPVVTTIVLEQDRNVDDIFRSESLVIGKIHKLECALSVARLLSLNPELESILMKVTWATAELWEELFNMLCPERVRLIVNMFEPAQYAITTLQHLELRDTARGIAGMIAPALLLHAPCALTSLNLCGSPIACAGAESLGRAFSGLRRLRYLDLRQCRIADRGCTGIAHHVSVLSRLERLNLNQNIIKDDGLKVLACAVTRLTNLKTINVGSNSTRLSSFSVMKSQIGFSSKHSQHKLVECVAWSPKGDKFVSGGGVGEVVIWDAEDGVQLSTLVGHDNTVTSAAWSPNADKIVSGSDDQTISIWDVVTRDKISTLKNHDGSVTSVAWSPTGEHIASGSADETIIVWDANTYGLLWILKAHTESVTSVAWSGKGDLIASGSYDKTIIIWEAKTGKKVSTLRGDNQSVLSVAWSPVYDLLASGSENKTIIIWEAMAGKQLMTLSGHTAFVTCIAWSPVAKEIVSGCGGLIDYDEYDEDAENEIIIWDVDTGRQISTHKAHEDRVSSVGWSPDGQHIVSGSYDTTVIIWDRNADQEADQASTLVTHKASVESVVWSPNGDKIACGSDDNNVIIWDASEENLLTLQGHISPVTTVAWSPDCRKIASGSEDKTIIIWDVTNKKMVSKLRDNCESSVRCVAWSPQGDRIASVSNDNTIIVWDAKGECMKAKGSVCLAWSPKGDKIVSGGINQTSTEIYIRDARTGYRISTLNGHSAALTCVAWSPNGDHIASGSKDKSVIIWDAKAQGQLMKILKGHTSQVNSVAWSPNGHRIASAGNGIGTNENLHENPGQIIIWNSRTGDHVSTMMGHSHAVTSVTWSPQGNYIASGSMDKRIIVWVDAK